MMSTTDLRCEYIENPLAIDTPAPRFSWIVRHPRRGERPVAYRIIVAASEELLQRETGDCWDSGKVASDATTHIVYAGKPLEPCRDYRWRVRWWDAAGNASPWSATASFGMGIQEWRASWITKERCAGFRAEETTLLGKKLDKEIQVHAIYLRKEFAADVGRFRRARLYVCGLGYYEARLNGQKVGDRVLDPAQTDYRKRALYSTYDVTPLIGKSNAIGVILGNGRHIQQYGYDKPKLTLQLLLEYEGKKEEWIRSDEGWKVAHGPLTENGVYWGETYDATREFSGWDGAGFDDATWERAVAIAGPTPSPQTCPPIRVTENVHPTAMWSPSPGIHIFDFGINFTGWTRLAVRGPRGTTIRLRHSEVVHKDGTINLLINQGAVATDTYILKGDGTEIHEPRFTYHGFRYVEMTGFPGVPTLDALEGRFFHTDVERTGSFHCSNDLINRIHEATVRGQRSNLMSIPTDCPQRDERHGWMGDAHLVAEEAAYNFDMASFFTKFIEDIRLAQTEEGDLPDVVPPYIPTVYPADPAWAVAYHILAWTQYWHYDDTRILERHYEPMKRYIGFLRGKAEGNIIRTLGKYGDWCPPRNVVSKKTPLELTSTWYYYQAIDIVKRTAEILGRKEDVATYGGLLEEVGRSFNETFLKEDQYAAHWVSRLDREPSQTSNVLPLALNMVPGEKREKVLERLLHSIVKLHDHHLDTGILGTRHLLDVLTDNGHGEIAYRIATQESYPGWGYMIREGATTLWERWEKLEGWAMNSHNHIMLGSVDAWFYRVLAGIAPLAPGWKRFAVRPRPLGDLTFIAASVKTMRGEVDVSWRKESGRFTLAVRVPVGAEADVALPLPGTDAVVKEGDRVIWPRTSPVEGVAVKGSDGNDLSLVLGGGDYALTVEHDR